MSVLLKTIPLLQVGFSTITTFSVTTGTSTLTSLITSLVTVTVLVTATGSVYSVIVLPDEYTPMTYCQ